MGVKAKEQDLQVWGQGGSRARYDYVSEYFSMVEMLTNDFFGNCAMLLRAGDHIYITDCEDQTIVVRCDEVDRATRMVYLSKMERLYALPVVALKENLPEDPGLIYRFRTPRGGGHSIITANGEVFAINFETRTDAERAIANIYDTAVFQAPHGHEPTEAYVSANAKAFSPPKVASSKKG